MVSYLRSDLEFILQQIIYAERQAKGESLTSILPNAHAPFGLRTVDGTLNNLVLGQSAFGAADNLFPRLTDPLFRTAEAGTSYQQTAVDPTANPFTDPVTAGWVIDLQPRTISNLIVDQTITNPAAVQAFVNAGLGTIDDSGNLLDLDGILIGPGVTLTIPNTTPDEGLSAGFNSWFTFFGQFFDHGLDLLTKGGSGIVFIPLQPDDPLYVEGSPTNFMILNRATNQPGPDGQLGTADDIHEHTNTTSPFVDQNQTYASHASHQAFLRAYELGADLRPYATGKLITNKDLGADGAFGGTGLDADFEIGGMATWGVLKAQARDILGINLTDADVGNVPLLATDLYGNLLLSPLGFPQVVVDLGDGSRVLVEGSPLAPIDLANPIPGNPDAFVVRTGHAFLDDIAHTANPFMANGAPRTGDADGIAGDHFSQFVDAVGNPALPGPGVTNLGNNQPGSGSTFYDNELLDAHYVAGDGRVNENIGLTAVHAVFHAEHNRLVDHTKVVILEAGDLAFLSEWLEPDTAPATFPANPAQVAALQWNGERLFQAAKFGTEMQYQHLVFEEFARKVQPMVDVFLAPEGYDATINAAITAEFAHTVYRFGHSMLLQTVDRLDPDFASSGIGLIEAFVNPLAFAASGPTPDQAMGAIVRGVTRQQGNEIDEFVTEVLRNNLLGLPLDLPTINMARGRDTGIPSLNAARTTFFEATGDAQLRPYTSWVDFMAHLKHPESLINFIAAYGTHASIVVATDMAGKRAAATLLVLGDGDDSDGVTIGSVTYLDRFAFLNATGAHTGGSLGGLNNVDFWVGGLAEAQMPFGGLMGSTFNFVFESQLEALQNGDRFYYLARTAGLNFLNELEGNSFAKLIMNNSDATHLPADVFSTPAFTLEVDRSKQFTGLHDPAEADGIVGNSDPTGGLEIFGVTVRALVERDDPGTTTEETHYLRYNGEDHVVLGGTDSGDIIISSIGDDTIWGDGGNDRLDGGDGVDTILGGLGDDIITDLGGDDVLMGEDGNDVISGGNGFNLILGGAGSDFIITGEDVSDTFGGEGNDFILGSPLNLPTLGNEGDDWIEIGTSDGAGGDNFDPLEAGTVTGHDVFITGTMFDEVDGEGGDDIMVGSDGPDHFGGGGGFDWASYENDTFGTTIDLNVNDFIEPPVAGSPAAVLDRFAQVEGLSGTNFNDVLRGDDLDVAGIAPGGAQDNTLNAAGIARIDGLGTLLTAAFGGAVVSFNGGNIILGGAGSDLIEGRGGDDVIDGDRRLNVRIRVNDADGSGNPLSFDSMTDPLLLQNMLNGVWNPGQLEIVREILTGNAGFDTAMFSETLQSTQTFRDVNGNDVVLTVDNYSIDTVGGVTTVRHLVYDIDLDTNGAPVVLADVLGADGEDRLVNVERLQFGDQSITLANGVGSNNDPAGQLTITDPSSGAPQINEVLTVSAAGITDEDNESLDNPTGAVTGPIAYFWQSEAIPGSGVFSDIITLDGARFTREQAGTLTVTPDLDGLRLRVRSVYEDDNGTLENVFSAPTLAVSGSVVVPPPAIIPVESETTSAGVHLIRSDLQFMLEQILIAERHAAGENPADILPNSRLPFGLRTVDGSFNNVVPGQEHFGAADQPFPTATDQVFRNEGDDTFTFDPDGPVGQPPLTVTNDNYAQTNAANDATVNVVDADPRIISNLISDQTITNPAAVQAFIDAGFGVINSGTGALHHLNEDGSEGAEVLPGETLVLPNTAPDEGLSAGFNSWFTFFGQFFDHGLDLVNKGGNGVVFVPLAADDPLVVSGRVTPGVNDFMILTRATNTAILPGADGDFNTSDDIHFHNNQTTPFVDQNQTYTSHASHQFFLREYVLDATTGRPVTTGKLLDGINPDDSRSGLPTWAQIKAQARDILGIQLDDQDVLNLPLIATDLYGNFIPDLLTGMPQIVTLAGPESGSLTTPIDASLAIRTNHAFLDDIAHTANPRSSQGAPLAADTDDDLGLANDPASSTAGFYDNELLDRHFATGDGRGNENIALTAVHHVFHAEHNRLVEHIQDVTLASNDVNFVNQWLSESSQLPPGTTFPLEPAAIDALAWNGERLFQAARFGTEMQYQHLVFEEFARKVQPQVDIFLGEGQGYDTTINPAILAEFAHTVYRFGHTMLTESIDRLAPDFAPNNIDLVQAFLNPLAFRNQDDTNTLNDVTADQAAGAIIRGMTRQAGQEIDEFVTEALRNNLLGLPLDLPTINIARGRDTGVPSLNQARTEFFAMTGDSQLRPYSSWADFMVNLKHPESVINFIAAYGTHSSVTSVDTMADKRAAATLLVLGGPGALDDRVDFLNALGVYAPDGDGPNDDSLGGLNTVDFWIGGLAERQMPFGGLLGSTFNFVFETQMENLQNADRFYYLERTAGLNFLTELENNSFAKLIMANTDTTHLAGDVFSTPAFTLEVDRSKQFTGLDDPADLDGIVGNSDPTGGIAINDIEITGLVIRNNPGTAGLDANFLHYTGGDHVVLGGTDPGNAANPGGHDIIYSGIGDDTLYGDGGDDRLDGGDGVDMTLGGAGDDIITDLGGDDNLQGGDGHDAIHGGNGIDLILGGFGNDFIITGEDGDESFGGTGNDFILGDVADEMVFGNEGDDWIEGGTADGGTGDSFDVRGLDQIIGNDVFMGDTVSDRMFGEGGDDIMIGNGGFGDRYLGGSGFDWASSQGDRAATVDMRIRAFDATPVPLSPVTVLPRFESIDGLSGSTKADILIGDDLGALQIAVSGAYGSVLTNISLIAGLQEYLDLALAMDDVQSFGEGNIILGGAGGDILAGGGGNDLIDGDRFLNVRIHVDTDNDGFEDVGEISVTSMEDIAEDVFAGLIKPGDLRIVREILSDGGFDTAEYSGNFSEYDIITVGDVTTVTHNLIDLVTGEVIIAGGADGIDRLTNVERLQFADQSLVLVSDMNNEPSVAFNAGLTLSGTPRVGDTVGVSATGVWDDDNISDTNPFGFIRTPVTYTWQVELRPGTGVFEDITIPTGLGDLRALGPTLVVTDNLLGLLIRTKGIYEDGNGTLETLFSEVQTVEAAGGNTTPVVLNPLDVTIFEDQPVQIAIPVGTFFDGQTAQTELAITVALANGDPLSSLGLNYYHGFREIWGQLPANFNGPLDILVTATDASNISVTETFTINVAPLDDAPTGSINIVSYTQNNATASLKAMNNNVDDVDGMTDVVTYQWQRLVGGVFTNIAGASAATLAGISNGLFRVVTTYTDDHGDQIVVSPELARVGTAAGNNVLVGSEIKDFAIGLGGNDDLAGGAGDDSLSGGSGNDRLRGGLGADAMNGGAGNDVYDVDNARDTIADVSGIDTVRSLLASYVLGAGLENLTLARAGNQNGTGNALANRIVGNASANVLNGGGQNDTLVGGGGNDRLIGGFGADRLNGGAGADDFSGGAGNDIYDFDTLSHLGNTVGTRDQILNFSGAGAAGGDIIDLSGIDAIAGGVNNAFTFVGSRPLTALGQLHFRTGAGGVTIIEGNVTGGTGADFQIEIAGIRSFVASDFVL